MLIKATLAQSVEQLIRNEQVEGSSPLSGSEQRLRGLCFFLSIFKRQKYRQHEHHCQHREEHPRYSSCGKIKPEHLRRPVGQERNQTQNSFSKFPASSLSYQRFDSLTDRKPHPWAQPARTPAAAHPRRHSFSHHIPYPISGNIPFSGLQKVSSVQCPPA